MTSRLIDGSVEINKKFFEEITKISTSKMKNKGDFAQILDEQNLSEVVLNIPAYSGNVPMLIHQMETF